MRNDCNDLWSARVKEFKNSGLNQSEYCKVNGYKIKQFNYWFRKFEKITSSALAQNKNWVSISIAPQVVTEPIILKIGAVTIEIKPGFNKDLLADVVGALNLII